MGNEKMRKAFSLVELAVVLVIIGLLVAGISVGSSLKDQAELRSIVSDMKQFQISYASFIDIYKMPPGDFSEAQAIWGSNCANTVSCNGNGNDIIDSPASSASETLRAWKHLDLAELIDESIPIVPSSWNGGLSLTDLPESQITGGGFFMAGGNISTTGATSIASPFGNDNAVFMGRERSGYAPTVGVITGLEAYNLDKKFDDGKINSSNNPSGNNSGMFRAVNGYFFGSNTDCVSGGNYNITSLTDSCLVGFKLSRDADG